NGNQITGEAPLKPGQILRLGQIELRLEDANAQKSPPKKLPDQTMVIPQGVRLGQEPATKTVPFEKNAFAKKSNNGTKIFIAVVVVLAVAVAILLFIVWNKSSG
ncbi:MAG TPA: hypothetical protein VH595_08250, partial [Verrucomicrobiae bacterium]|nr:hypothetical protein [Verrucomicrobiae bacterium]